MKDKLTLELIGGTLLGVTSWLFGTLDQVLATFVFFVVVDYCTGMVAAFVNGTLDSHRGYAGILKKAAALVLVAVIYRADTVLPAFNGWESPLRDILIYALAINDLISIVENLGEWGLKVPKVVRERLAQLRDLEKQEDKE